MLLAMGTGASIVEKDLVAIPGAESTLGLGQSKSTLRLSAGKHFGGTHTDNPSYFSKPKTTDSPFGVLLRLKTVCWLNVYGTMKDVPNSSYEAILRVKVSTLNFVGDWRIWVADSSGVGTHNYQHGFPEELVDDIPGEKALAYESATGHMPLVLRNHKRKGRGGKLLQTTLNKWTKLSFGVVRVSELSGRGTVKFAMGGGNKYWCGPMDFDYLELRRIGLDYKVVRQLAIGVFKKVEQNKKCRLNFLAPSMLRHLLRFVPVR